MLSVLVLLGKTVPTHSHRHCEHSLNKLIDEIDAFVYQPGQEVLISGAFDEYRSSILKTHFLKLLLFSGFSRFGVELGCLSYQWRYKNELF